MSEFEWQPSYNYVTSKQPRVNSVTFGDGYEQRVRDGINDNLRTWNLTFTRKIDEINSIDSFLDTKGGADSFTWTIRGEEVRVICRKWSKEDMAPLVGRITCSFEEVPA